MDRGYSNPEIGQQLRYFTVPSPLNHGHRCNIGLAQRMYRWHNQTSYCSSAGVLWNGTKLLFLTREANWSQILHACYHVIYTLLCQSIFIYTYLYYQCIIHIILIRCFISFHIHMISLQISWFLGARPTFASPCGCWRSLRRPGRICSAAVQPVKCEECVIWVCVKP